MQPEIFFAAIDLAVSVEVVTAENPGQAQLGLYQIEMDKKRIEATVDLAIDKILHEKTMDVAHTDLSDRHSQPNAAGLGVAG